MNLKNLEYFIAVVDENSFTNASQKLYVSQSTLSKSIAYLEDTLNLVLLDREKKDFQLTPAGKIFYQYAQDVLKGLDERTQKLYYDLNQLAKVIRIGLPPSSGTIIFSDIFILLRKEHPEIAIQTHELTSLQLLDQVEQRELDLGVVIEPFEDPRFDKLNILESEAVLVIPEGHPWSKREEMTFKDLEGIPLIMISAEYMFYQKVMDCFKAAKVQPMVSFESYQWDMILQMVRNGRGITILPKPLIERVGLEGLHMIHLEEPNFPWGLTLIWPKNVNLREEIKIFLEVSKKASSNL